MSNECRLSFHSTIVLSISIIWSVSRLNSNNNNVEVVVAHIDRCKYMTIISVIDNIHLISMQVSLFINVSKPPNITYPLEQILV